MITLIIRRVITRSENPEKDNEPIDKEGAHIAEKHREALNILKNTYNENQNKEFTYRKNNYVATDKEDR